MRYNRQLERWVATNVLKRTVGKNPQNLCIIVKTAKENLTCEHTTHTHTKIVEVTDVQAEEKEASDKELQEPTREQESVNFPQKKNQRFCTGGAGVVVPRSDRWVCGGVLSGLF